MRTTHVVELNNSDLVDVLTKYAYDEDIVDQNGVESVEVVVRTVMRDGRVVDSDLVNVFLTYKMRERKT